MSQHRYPPRDRSPPPRQFDRRASNTYTPTATSSSYRPANDSSQTSVDRPPPRGPRADNFRGGFNSTPRGRGAPFVARGGDSWDRERDRDVRDPPGTFRRDIDRPDWPRRDERPQNFNRERSYVGNRERSASPIRSRRDSKEAISTPFNRGQDSGSSYFPANARGGADRGRGRGGWDRGRDRSSFVSDRERELFPNRSRSRDEWRDREFDRPRPFTNEIDRNDRFDRREFDRPPDRDLRGRDHDVWQRDASPGRSSTGNRAPSPGALSAISQDRKFDYEVSRKTIPPSGLQNRETRREADSDYFSSRTEPPRREAPFAQPPPAPAVSQSAAFGLDYGPPPSTPAATPAPPAPSTEKVTASVKPPRPEPSPVSTNTFQPPSGPKADRSLPLYPSTQHLQQAPPSIDSSRVKVESNVRARPQQPETTTQHTVEFNKSTGDQINDRASSMTSGSDRPLPHNVPSGPRLSIGVPYKPRTSPIAPQTALPPAQPKPLNIDQRPIGNAPTGPRSASILPPSGPRASLPSGPASAHPGPASAAWRRPQLEYRPQKPSIMGNMNRPNMADRVLPQSTHLMPRHSPKQSFKQIPEAEKGSSVAKPSITQPLVAQETSPKGSDTPGDVEMSAQVSEDEDADDEPESELDENYFADSEKSHAREMALLRSRMPPPLLEDPSIVRLLVRIQLLGMIAEGLVPESIRSVKHEKNVEMADKITTDIPSPQTTPQDSHSPPIEHPKPRGRPLKEPPVNPIPTPPMEDLPFLLKQTDRPTGTVVFDEFSDSDDVQEEQMNTVLTTQFESQAWEEKDNLQELSEFYRSKFPEWKYELEQYERLRISEATPDPGSPGAQSAVSIPPSVERLTGRAARNATEFDIEKVILLSEQSAREDAERREREASSNAKPNYDTEAVVPDMLPPADRDLDWRFEDRNFLVPTEYSVELMEFVPPEDDFTKEEQAKFVDAFCRTPKKWGLIAEQIPDRNYQQCIAHYYLTKNEARYKDIWRRSQPKRKRGRAATKPRSTALLSDMALNEDPDATPAPVTDSGRPRRAAAPTFGDVPEPESALLPAAKRVALGPKDGVENTAPKAAKGRKAGTATKVRRTKAQIAADNQALATQAGGDPTLVRTTSGRVRPLIRAENIAVKADVIAPPNMAEAQPIQPLPITMPASQVRQDQLNPPVVTSYWSVPEQQKFRQLIAYYGRDYTKIADFMKTKSQAMIKNHYSREVSKGDTELERVAISADERVARGEPLGRIPSPIAPPKRKYDPIPVMTASGRPLTADGQAPVDPERTGFSMKGSLVDDFPANTIHRDANGSIVTKPSPRDDFLSLGGLHSGTQSKHEDFLRDRPIAQKPSGPPRGHFTDDAYLQAQSRQQHANGERVGHHHPAHVMKLSEEQHPIHSRDILGQNRDSLFHNQSASQTPRYRNLEAERPSMQIRHNHSRNPSHTGPATSVTEQQGMDLLALPSDRNRMFGLGVTQSPRMQPLQASVASRSDHYPFMQQQAQPQPPIKQEPAKPAKRSNILDMLNNDEPPERPVKRSSTDSIHRTLMQTPPPQTLAPQAQPLYMQRGDPIAPRPMSYGQGPSNLSESRNAYSSSPAPSHRPGDWLDQFDPRKGNGQQTSNQSPLYVPPAPTGSKLLLQDLGERPLEMGASRRGNLGRGPLASPPVQASTPTQQYRSSSTAPQHSRMSSLGYPQNSQSNLDHRSHQHSSQQSQPHQLQQVTLPPSTQGTPISSLHSRAQPSNDYTSRRLTIQEYKAQNPLDQVRDMRDAPEARMSREEALARSGGPHDPQHRQIVPPPGQQPPQHEASRQQDIRDSRDPYRSEPASHQVPPPPRSSVFNPTYPPRSYNNTPPISPFASGSDPRSHAHQHHHSLSTQPPSTQSQQSSNAGSQVLHHHHLPHQQQQQQQQSGMVPHGHQGQAQQQYRDQQQQQQRYGGGGGSGQQQQGLMQQSHYRNYSQGGQGQSQTDERR